MSLKAFHIVFIILAIFLAAGCATWSFMNEIAIPFGIASAAAGCLLFVYGLWFLKKARRIIT
jgi:hypothetical protein